MDHMKESNYSPIVLFVYDRLDHVRQCIDALLKNDLAQYSNLIIFSDGPKVHNEEKVQSVREYIRTIVGFSSIDIHIRERNIGLANSVISGVTEVIRKYGRVIVLEDDLITSPYFLKYMNDALNLYENDNNVISIHGYIYPVTGRLPDTFFLIGADCWGWATWERKWDYFEEDGNKLLDAIIEKKRAREFNFNDSYPYLEMLKDQTLGKNDSWAIRWYASAFINNMYTLYPGKSLIKNIGLDNSGTHCVAENIYNLSAFGKEIQLKKIKVTERKKNKNKIITFFSRKKKGGLLRLLRKLGKFALPYGIIRIIEIRKKEEKDNLTPDFFIGPVENWDKAATMTIGYDSDGILESCSIALEKVKNGEAVYERDSVLFDKIFFSWPLLVILLIIKNKYGKINVLDFGGSLGSSYYQNRHFLNCEVDWNIVEQNNFVAIGEEKFASEDLHFYSSIDDCLLENEPDLVLLSSVIPYLKDKDSWIERIVKINAEYIVIDRTLMSYGDKDEVFIQNVPDEIYAASYPLWFSSEKKLLGIFRDKYRLLFNEKAFTNSVINYKDYDERCYVFERINH